MADMDTQESVPPDSSLNDPDDAEIRSVPKISERNNTLNLDMLNLSSREESVMEWSFLFKQQ